MARLSLGSCTRAVGCGLWVVGTWPGKRRAQGGRSGGGARPLFRLHRGTLAGAKASVGPVMQAAFQNGPRR